MSPRVPDLLPPAERIDAEEYLQLDPEPSAVSAARRFVRSRAHGLSPETEDVLLLLTSELVTNAVLHARTQIRLGLMVAEHHVVVTVHDLDLALPDQVPYVHREGGWGLGLVEALAQESAMYVHPEGGKTAWFRLPRGAAPDSSNVADSAAARDERKTS